MKIGELARRTLHTAETIRYYERMGLLPAPRRFALAGACCGRHAEGEPCGLLERLSHPDAADDGPDVS